MALRTPVVFSKKSLNINLCVGMDLTYCSLEELRGAIVMIVVYWFLVLGFT